MFKISNILTLSLVGVNLMYSCKKTEQLDKPETVNRIEYKLDKIPLTTYQYPVSRSTEAGIESLLLNPLDTDDEKINQYLYKLSLATRDLIKDPVFNQIIIDLAKVSETKCANLLDLETIAPNFYNIINNNLEEYNLSLKLIAGDLTHKPIYPNTEYPETAVLEHYIPSIFIPNLSSLNESLQPLISPNIEVDPMDNEAIEDNIITWLFSNEDAIKVTEIILSEETSLITTNPIFLINNGTISLETEENKNAPSLNNARDQAAAGATSGILSFASYEYGIGGNYRYERLGKSEFAVVAIRIDPSGAPHWIYSGVEKTIGKVELNQLNTTQYKWSHHADDWKPWSNPWTPNAYQNGVNMVFWNTFERDWNRSQKGIGTCSANGTTIHLRGRMKYNSEWYSWIPNTANVHYTRFQWLDSDWAHWNNSWKSTFRLWKVYI